MEPTIIKSLIINMDKGETDYFFAKEANRRYPQAVPMDDVENSVYEVEELVFSENGQLTVLLTVNY